MSSLLPGTVVKALYGFQGKDSDQQVFGMLTITMLYLFASNDELTQGLRFRHVVTVCRW